MAKKPHPERVRGRTGRRVDIREVRQRFLIVCEGEQTEPNYFRAFQVPGLVITIKDTRERGKKLIQKAEHLRELADYDQVWCVFDRDDLTPSQIAEAYQYAQQTSIRIAFSNQAFEIWYLLHFDYHNTAITRSDYCERLGKKIGQEYTKNSHGMYNLLFRRQALAMVHAARLIAQYTPRRPAEDDPATTVYELVDELNKYRRP
ncbi:abortive phage resistance protein [Oscillochloris trichoides DG-6]|uniref:Abortive phage resistance protein n=1 Tax=Oscillochloris trichoides DG-6 TaxID=765420 RepID=E1IFY2_9CHLR|nr:RloB family protein [Oscillochloris trichoides]EFO79871.1 abortive phage resistance protein [Oscillochloris trichoides DG-6]